MKTNRDKTITFLLNNKALLLLILVFTSCSAISPYFLGMTNLRNVLRQISTSCVLAFGYTCIMSSGNIDLSVGYMAGMIGVVYALLDTETGLPFLAVVLIALALGACCGLISSSIMTGVGLLPFIVTLSLGQVYKGACYVISKNAPISGVSEHVKFLGQGFVWAIPVPVIIMIVIGIITYVLLNKTIFGRNIVAMGGNKETARLAGIDPRKTTMAVYVCGGICVAIAAMMLTGRAASAQVTAGQGMEMDAIAAVVIGGTSMKGGKAKVIGTFFGVCLMGLLANILNLLGVDSNYQYIAKGMMILVAVVLDKVSEMYFNYQLKKAVTE